MKQSCYTVMQNLAVARNTYMMELSGDVSAVTRPGQFINIKLDGYFLRRPISIYEKLDSSLKIIYKTVGSGTEFMSTLPPGTVLDVLTGLGNGYDTSKSGEKPLLIGGGAGIPPLYELCKCLIKEKKHPSVILGFNTSDEMFCIKEFEELGADVTVTTADGSFGIKGFVTDAMGRAEYTYFYTCGPMPMLRAVNGAAKTSGQFSFEERMGCGFGACMGCSCKTLTGNKRICKEGPVLEREEIIWQAQR